MDDESRFDDEKRFLKFWIIGSVTVLVVLGLAFFPGRSFYRQLKEKHSAAQALAFFAKGDYRNAWLSAREALLLNSNNVDACLVMAELNDVAHSPSTLDWCQKLVRLSPAVTNKLLLASMGLRYQDPPYPLTSQVLGDLSTSATNLPAYHLISAQLDLSLHRMAEAEVQFEAACQLEPSNRLFQLNLAVIRLASTNAAVAQAARAALKQFAGDANLGPPALRSLIADRLLHNDATAALDYSTQLLATAQANLGDRLQQLDILQRLHSHNLAAQLSGLQKEAATSAAMAAQIASWMEANGYQAETVTWLKTLPANTQAQTPVRLAFVDCYLETTNWMALRTLTSGGDWGEADFLRLAFSSRAWNELGEQLLADGAWRSAVSEAGERLGALTALLDLANRWNMPHAREDLLERIVRRFPDARWAREGLERLYFVNGDTAGLYQFYLNQLARSPQNALLKNNLACTALLLKTNLTRAFQWAADAYTQDPSNADVVSTYAYALHLQNRDPEGLAALQKLSRSQLKETSVALYYGLLLSATGKGGEAAPYLQIARTKSQLLPEEKRLLAEADKRALTQ